MSTGLDCGFVERTPNNWYLMLEQDYGSKIDIEYDEYGPFDSYADANNYLRRNFANPGGAWIDAHDDSTDESWKEIFN